MPAEQNDGFDEKSIETHGYRVVKKKKKKAVQKKEAATAAREKANKLSKSPEKHCTSIWLVPLPLIRIHLKKRIQFFEWQRNHFLPTLSRRSLETCLVAAAEINGCVGPHNRELQLPAGKTVDTHLFDMTPSG